MFVAYEWKKWMNEWIGALYKPNDFVPNLVTGSDSN